jgi:cold shock CspA family protein
MIWQEGTVRWWDELSGTGVIRVGAESIFCHYSDVLKEVPLSKEFFHRMLFKNSKVQVKVIRDSHYIQIGELK